MGYVRSQIHTLLLETTGVAVDLQDCEAGERLERMHT